MIQTIKQAFKMKDVRTKILWTFGLLLVYRIGCFIPIPGISPEAFASSWRDSNAGSFLEILNQVAGGALENGAILALGVGPYITSSIVIQLLTIALPPLERLSKQGDEGRRKLAVYTRYAALFMSLAQAIAIAVSFNLAGNLNTRLFGEAVPEVITILIVILVLTAGAMFTVWIGDKITEHGVSNGMSMLIFVGILSTGALAFYNSIVEVFSDINAIVTPIVFIVTLVIIFALIVFVDLGERKIPVSYAKQIKGNKQYGGQSSHIPLKINSVGVLPIIFAFSLLNFPQLIFSFFQESNAYIWYATNMGMGTWPNIILTSLLILAFSYFYASIMFNPDDVARSLQQNGGYIIGYRPGIPTRDYLRKVHRRMTFFGAVFLAFMALIPSIIFTAVMGDQGNILANSFTSIGLLICVSVALEFDKQLQAAMMMKTYKGFLK
ncbi:MAG: preprotein translocase subunit SecY [Firmicutes bacterium]|nr:preprotein translocase subunit SecY [Bacillota bacterium]